MKDQKYIKTPYGLHPLYVDDDNCLSLADHAYGIDKAHHSHYCEIESILYHCINDGLTAGTVVTADKEVNFNWEIVTEKNNQIR